jgi:5-methylcytosine-specific restriction endonuclease McrA
MNITGILIFIVEGLMQNRSNRDPDYRQFRQAVLRRDNYTCQMPYCGKKKNLRVHHVKIYAKYPTIRTDINNGITLCSKCHKSVHGKEKRYASLFLSIIQGQQR